MFTVIRSVISVIHAVVVFTAKVIAVMNIMMLALCWGCYFGTVIVILHYNWPVVVSC